MNKIFFTSDNHFGHKASIYFGKRPFKDVDDMTEQMIERWNSKVDSGDRVYVLGDFVWNDIDPEPILKRLNGEKYLITGNHDRIGKHNEEIFLKYFKWIKDYFVLKIKNGENIPSTKIVLFHYPIEVWDAQHYGSLHLYGHIHESCAHLEMNNICNRYNVGVDVNGFAPIEYNDIIKWLKENNLYKTDYKDILRERDKLWGISTLRGE